MTQDRTNSLKAELNVLRARVAELESLLAGSGNAEAALKEADRRYRDLFEMAGDSLFIIEVPSQKIIEVNKNASRRLGYTAEELSGLLYSDIEMEHPAEPPTSPAWKSAFSRTTVYETQHRRKDGSWVDVEVSSRLIGYKGKTAVLNAVRDISPRKKFDAEREQLIAELDAYAHTVAHDLKNPITLLAGFSDLLLTDLQAGAWTKDTQMMVECIHSSALKMRDIVNELLLLASVRKQDSLPTSPLNMAAIVEEVLLRLSNIIEESGAVIIQPDEWPEAIGYAAWVEEIWVNYISNAIKYGGQPPHVALGAQMDGGMVRFSVRDNGAGIASEDQDQLFREFSRLDHVRAEGHGLGLSIVYSIVTKLGGEVGISSTPGQGSAFTFTLPAPES